MDHIIKDYLRENDISAVDFCKKVGMDTSHLQRIYNRKRYPSRALAKRIYHFTVGEIHPNDILDPKTLIEFDSRGIKKGFESWRMTK